MSYILHVHTDGLNSQRSRDKVDGQMFLHKYMYLMMILSEMFSVYRPLFYQPVQCQIEAGFWTDPFNFTCA